MGNDFVRLATGEAPASGAIRADGTFELWGLTSIYTQPESVPPPPGLRVRSISIGSFVISAVALDGSLVCWGYPRGSLLTPPAGNDFVEVAMSMDCAVARRADGSLATWGQALSDDRSTFMAPSGNDFVALGKPMSFGQFAIRTANHTPRAPELGPNRNVGGVHLGYPSNHVRIYPDVINDLDPDNDALTYIVSENGNVLAQWEIRPLCFTGSLWTMPYEANYGLYIDTTVGVHTFRMTVTDPFGESAFDEVTITVYPDPNQGPIANAGSDTTYYVPHGSDPMTTIYRSDMEPYTGLDGSASYDPDGDVLDAFWTDEHGNIVGWWLTVGGYWEWWGLSSYDADGNWIDGLTMGDHKFTLTVTDPYGKTSTSTTTIHIVAQNAVPVAIATSNSPITAVHKGNPTTDVATVQLDGSTSSDPDGDALTFEWKKGSSVLGTGALLLTSLTPGDHTITLTVRDSYGAIGQKSITVHVSSAPNAAPVLTVPATAAVNVGCPVTVQVSATDTDRDALTYSKAGGPSWAIVSSNGSVTFDPPSGTVGTFIVSIIVTDTYGASDQKALAITGCPITIDGVTVSKKNGQTTVQFNVRNTDGTMVNSLSLNSSTLKGIATNTGMPITFAQLKQGVSKSVQLKFNGVPNGAAQFIVNGSSSAGPVNANLTVNVP